MSYKKIHIVLPDARIHKINIWPFRTSFREAPLTATTLAAYIPKNISCKIIISDESVGQDPFQKEVDLVAISVLTGTAHRAYEIADYYRKLNIPVVLGGVHVTLLPDEAALHADCIVTGFAEQTWPELLLDFFDGNLKSRYDENRNENKFSSIPTPKRDLQKRFGYMMPNTISATRGCKGVCDFCAVPAAEFGWQTRPIQEVVDEIKLMNPRRIVFNDVSMGEDMIYFKALLKALIPLKISWGGLASTKIFRDPEIVDLLQKSGCSYLLIGLESISEKSLSNISKGFNKVADYAAIIKDLRRINVVLMGTFIFGLDSDDKSVFERTVDYVNSYKIDIPRYAIYTPYPKTASFNRLKSQGRILHEYWPHYDTQHVVFDPLLMSVRELDEGFKWAYKNTFQIASSFRRTIASRKNFLITFDLGEIIRS